MDVFCEGRKLPRDEIKSAKKRKKALSMTSPMTRRQVLLAGAAACLTVFVPTVGNADDNTAAQAALPDPKIVASFIALSQMLTGKDVLDAGFAGRIVTVMGQSAGFGAQLSALLQAAAAHGDDMSGLYAALKAQDPALAKLSQQIMEAWYLGVVGGGQHAQCVAYATSLAQQAVRDYIRPPTYAYGAYGTWAEPPHSSNAS